MKKGWIILIIIISIFVIASMGLAWKFYFEEKFHYTEDIEISQLREQIQLLREDREASRPSPSPSPAPVTFLAVLDKSKITPENFYTLNCWHQKIPDNTTTKTIKSHLEANESLIDICVNNALNNAVYLSSYAFPKNGYDFKIFDFKSQTTKTISNLAGWGGGVCAVNIYLWSKENDLYYKRLACDGEPNNAFEYINKIHLENI